MEIAKKLRECLEEAGYRVLMTRCSDTYLTKEQRAEAANVSGAEAFVSIHQNTYEDGEPSGIETWYDGTDQSRDSRRLAQLIHGEAVKRTGARERQLRGDAGFVVTGWTKMPACLIETGFLSSPEEAEKLSQPEYQEKLAEGIARGIDAFFHPKTMYLTFDDGPSAENTAAVLDVLKDRNIKATFFVVGENVKKNPGVARRIVAEGHTIKELAEIGRSDAWISKHLGMDRDEILRLKQITGLTALFKDVNFGAAWVPEEEEEESLRRIPVHNQ